MLSLRSVIAALVVLAVLSQLELPALCSDSTAPNRGPVPSAQSGTRLRPQATPSAETERNARVMAASSSPVFEPNYGQFDERVRAFARFRGMSVFLTDTGATMTLVASGNPGKRSDSDEPFEARQEPDHNGSSYAAASVEMVFRGGSRCPTVEPQGRLSGVRNYCNGPDPSKWIRSVPTFASTMIRDIYPGIDVRFYEHGGKLEYDLIIEPGSDVAAIEIDFKGATAVQLPEDGSLEVSTPIGSFHHGRPNLYQDTASGRRTVAGRYVRLSETSFSFAVSDYDVTLPLTIDPHITAATHLGGTADDYIVSMQVDEEGSIYVLSGTNSVDFPDVPAPGPGVMGRFVLTKLNSIATDKVCVTVLPTGSSYNDLALGHSGRLYLAGSASGPGLPTTSNAYSSIPPVDMNAGTLLAFESDCSTPAYGSFFGASAGMAGVHHIAVDADENVFVAGRIDVASHIPSAFPIVGAFPTNILGEFGTVVQATFVARLDLRESGTRALKYSALYGGAAPDQSTGNYWTRVADLATDNDGGAYIVGDVSAFVNFPIVNAFQPTPGDSPAYSDGFIAKIDTTRSGSASLVYSSFAGGAGQDELAGVAVDSMQRAYAVGTSEAENFPLVAPLIGNQAGYDGVLLQVDPMGTLLFSSYFGGADYDQLAACTVIDSAKQMFSFIGRTASPDFPSFRPLAELDGAPVALFYMSISTIDLSRREIVMSTRYGGNEGSHFPVDVQSGGGCDLTCAFNDGGSVTPFVAQQGAYQDTRLGSAPNGFVLSISGLGIDEVAPDPTTEAGALPVSQGDYKLAPMPDAGVPGGMVELWASVWYPTGATSRLPLIVMLHGNHYGCGTPAPPPATHHIDTNNQYQTMRTCPPMFSVVRSDLGYGYLAEKLAERGYLVVSINAHLGVTGEDGGGGSDPDLINARARLVLNHLKQLSTWDSVGGTPSSVGIELKNLISFSQVGLFGHSRGGEGVRVALKTYRASPTWQADIPGLMIRSIFEIGPTDSESMRTPPMPVDASDVNWCVLLPMCDGDVFPHSGQRVFDRMISGSTEITASVKAVFAVWGTNHNFYNTEWQTQDHYGQSYTTVCSHDALVGGMKLMDGNKAVYPEFNGSAQQRASAMVSVVGFFRGTVGASPDRQWLRVLDPRFALPRSVARYTRVDRAYTDSLVPSESRVIDNFSGLVGMSSNGVADNQSHLLQSAYGKIYEHADELRVHYVAWRDGGRNTWFQPNWSAPGTGINISQYQTLEFRTSRSNATAAVGVLGFNKVPLTSFRVQLVDSQERLSNLVSICDYVELRGPVGIRFTDTATGDATDILHHTLQSVRVPLSAFGTGFDFTKLRGVRFVFDESKNGSVALADLRVSKAPVVRPAGHAGQLVQAGPDSMQETVGGVLPADEGAVEFMATAGIDSVAGGDADDVQEPAGRIVAIRRVVDDSFDGEPYVIQLEVSLYGRWSLRNATFSLRIGSVMVPMVAGIRDDGRTLLLHVTRRQFRKMRQGDKMQLVLSLSAPTITGMYFGELNKKLLLRSP